MSTLTDSLKEMGATKLAIIGGVAALMLGFFTLIITSATTPPLAPLYSGLSLEDSNQIVNRLEGLNIPYSLQMNGSQISVPSDEVMRMRLRMAGEGIPSGGSLVGFEVFDKSEALGTSNFVHNVNYMRALEGELSRTIGAMQNVSFARVHLVMPKRELFSRDRTPPTASVVLNLKSSNKPSKEEVAAIRHLVATAVPGLSPEQITIVDSSGHLLARGGAEEDNVGAAVSDAEDFRINYERRMASTIEQLLEESIGSGKVRAQVSADINFDRIETTSEIYDPDGQVARSVQTVEEREDNSERSDKDNVSVANNLPDAANSDAGLAASNSSQRLDETTNFEISKTIKKHVRESGVVKKLSIAVLIDGSYTINEDNERIYVPRPQESLDQLATLVKSAIGYDEQRGDTVEIINMQFVSFMDEPVDDSSLDWLKRDFSSIVETLLFGVVAILGILLVVRPLINHLIDFRHQVEDEERLALDAPDIAGQITDQSMQALPDLTDDEVGDDEEMIDISMVQGKVKSSSLRRVTSLIDKYPDETLGVIRTWIAGG